jgi:hypothetical protein
MKQMKHIKPLNEATNYQFDFEDWDSTDLAGPSVEMSIDNLIDEYKKLIDKEVERFAEVHGIDLLDVKRQAAAAVRKLWIEKINEDLKF